MASAPWWTLPYQAYTYQPKNKLGGILGKIHEAIDPVRAYGGYGGVLGAVFGGPRANLEQLINENGARFMGLPADVNALKAWRDTGWARGADQGLRFEISDADASLNRPMYDKMVQGEIGKSTGVALKRILDHPKLFKAYPELENFPVHYAPELKPNTAAFGRADIGGNVILMGKMPNPDYAKSALMHEIQHAIQDIEGFSQGTTGGTSGYFTNPGEIEARAVQRRLPLTEAQRRLIFPSQSTDIPAPAAKGWLPW